MANLHSFLKRNTTLVSIIVISIVLGASLSISLSTHRAYASDTRTISADQRSALHGLEDAFTSIVDQVGPSVVKITSEMKPSTARPANEDPFKGLPFPFQMPAPGGPDDNTPGPAPQATGTGVIVRPDGFILTNDHVVGGAETVTVKLKDGREFRGKVLRDPKSDLALVKIDASRLPAVKLGDSHKVKVGSWAIAIGSPFGLDQTVTVGIVSAVKRPEAVQEKFYPDLIQTDAAINPGNSGGPLVNIDGEVIGINTLIRGSMGGGNIGIGFAIPVDVAKYVMTQLMEHGKVTRGFLGIVPVDLTPSDQDTYGVTNGAYVQSVSSGGPADKAGIQPEDVITEIDGKKIIDSLSLRNVMEAIAPGRNVKIAVVRNKVVKIFDVKISESKVQQASSDNANSSMDKLGFTVEDLTADIISQLKLPAETKGVVVSNVNPSSKAARNDLRPGLVIVQVNDTKVTSVAEFQDATKGIKPTDILRLRIRTADGITVIKFALH